MEKDVERSSRDTLRGFGELANAERIADDLAVAAPAPVRTPFPEFERVDVAGGTELLSGDFTAYAVHTQRRVYCLDGQLVCRAVLDLGSLVPVPLHPVIGASLVGAQHKDAEGRVIVPPGTVVNPLDTVSLSQALLFIDARDREQVARARKLIDERQGKVKVILTGGSYLDLMRRWQRPVFYDQQGNLTTKLGIRQVPALVTQDGRRLRIDELL